MESFRIHPSLAKKIFLYDLPLCRVLLENNKFLPWVLLVPRVNEVAQINQLASADRAILMDELNFVSNAMERAFECNRLNVAAIGNKTDQLHIHIICRSINDPYWPETVWQYPGEKMNDREIDERIRVLREAFDGVRA
jgi:diadenosine tetraphosphate (Ap4A) HIT family hydrolase